MTSWWGSTATGTWRGMMAKRRSVGSNCVKGYDISEEALAYASARYRSPDWATGTIQRPDAAFLYDIVRRQSPRRVAEIGVGAGVSTVFLATLLGELYPDSRLYAFDNLDGYYADQSRPVGDYVYERFGRVPANLTLAPGIASSATRDWPGRPQAFDLVFIDACHQHPWPCNDLLSILDLIVPGAWVVLHDVWLPLLLPQSQQFGPLYLFQSWPGEKCAPFAERANIGAIRLFDDPRESAAALIACCEIPWYSEPPRSEWTSSLQALAGIDAELAADLRAIVARPPLARRPLLGDYEVVIRGANRWSQISSDPMSGRIVLHANRRNDPDMSLTLRGLEPAYCQGIMFPSIVRCNTAPCALLVSLALKPDHGMATCRSLLLTDDALHFAALMAPAGRFDVEIGVSLAGAASSTRGAWVRFDGAHFV